jgi:hypothetical protein
LISEIKGIPTIARYTCATVFVDHFSDITYVHFQKSTGAVDTIDGKKRLNVGHDLTTLR